MQHLNVRFGDLHKKDPCRVIIRILITMGSAYWNGALNNKNTFKGGRLFKRGCLLERHTKQNHYGNLDHSTYSHLGKEYRIWFSTPENAMQKYFTAVTPNEKQ